MRELLIRVLTVSTLCGLAELMTPAGERDGLRRAVRLLSALFLLSVLLAPLSGLLERVGGIDLGQLAEQMEEQARREYGALMEEKLTAATAAQLEESLYALLAQQLGVSREHCRITVRAVQGDGGLQVSGVWIALRGEAALIDPRRIETLVGETVGCPCSVSLG